MTILDTIIKEKEKEVELLHKAFVRDEQALLRKTISMVASLRAANSTGIIAEFKRKSPSKGWFKADPIAANDVVLAYEKFGAAGTSILTDESFFGGSNKDIIDARQQLSIPVLRKDFIIDELQITEAKQIGADVILLIAACLSPTRVKELTLHAQSLGLEVLLELHDPKEVDRICNTVDMIGINNRNLKTFEVNIAQSINLAKELPANKVKVAESGINEVETIKQFKDAGFEGFLIGECFMKATDTPKSFEQFVTRLKGIL